MTKPALNLIHLENVSIYQQLQIEEALLRLDNRNWCLINSGSKPAIVLGISGKPDLLINSQIFQENPVPVIRRFSGGGTVVINENTVFTTFICNSEELNVPPLPQDIFRWSEKIYQPVFKNLDFRLQENDYVIGDKKFGGNAQYLRKNRWLHHTSFLFDYDEHHMKMLKFPQKVPAYRQNRNHIDFLCKLNHYFPSKRNLKETIVISLDKYFDVKKVERDIVEELSLLPHRKSTTYINI